MLKDLGDAVLTYLEESKIKVLSLRPNHAALIFIIFLILFHDWLNFLFTTSEMKRDY